MQLGCVRACAAQYSYVSTRIPLIYKLSIHYLPTCMHTHKYTYIPGNVCLIVDQCSTQDPKRANKACHRGFIRPRPPTARSGFRSNKGNGGRQDVAGLGDSSLFFFLFLSFSLRPLGGKSQPPSDGCARPEDAASRWPLHYKSPFSLEARPTVFRFSLWAGDVMVRCSGSVHI